MRALRLEERPPSPPAPLPRAGEGSAKVLLATALVLGAGLRIWLALRDDGMFWPDEVFQSLEPAHRLVFGYGLVAWEFIAGARSWALPGFVAGLFELARVLGLSEPRGYLLLTRLAFCGIGVGTVWATYRLARTLGAQSWAAACGATLFAFMGVAIYFAPRAMSETACALPLTLGFAIALDRSPLDSARGERKKLWLGASLLALAVFFRLQNGYFCLGLLAMLLGARRKREAWEALGVFVVWAAVFGLVDRLTWGGWFHSAIAYVQFNATHSGGFGREPIYFYAQVLLSALGAMAALLALGAGLAWSRARSFVALAALFVLLHSLILHKELRFLFPTFPLFCALAALGWERLRHGAPVMLAVAAVSAASLPWLTFARLGLRPDPTRTAGAFDDGGPENRLLWAASQLPDLCGLKVMTRARADTGGYSFFHRDVPLYGTDSPGSSYNYVIAPSGADSHLALTRISDRCPEDPSFDWKLR